MQQLTEPRDVYMLTRREIIDYLRGKGYGVRDDETTETLADLIVIDMQEREYDYGQNI